LRDVRRREEPQIRRTTSLGGTSPVVLREKVVKSETECMVGVVARGEEVSLLAAGHDLEA